MKVFILRTMPIFCHEMQIDVNGKKIKVMQDFNCRFAKDGYILFTNFVAARGYYSHVF